MHWKPYDVKLEEDDDRLKSDQLNLKFQSVGELIVIHHEI
jgi:hypothetical protein